jgi:hypothetical protein
VGTPVGGTGTGALVGTKLSAVSTTNFPQ